MTEVQELLSLAGLVDVETFRFVDDPVDLGDAVAHFAHQGSVETCESQKINRWLAVEHYELQIAIGIPGT